MISDIKLSNNTHDLVFENDDLVLFPTEQESITQRIKIGLSTVAGEWFLNTGVGLPLTSPTFAQKGSQTVLDAYIKQFIVDFEGVQELLTYSSRLDRATRTTYVSFTARIDSGEIISFTEAL